MKLLCFQAERFWWKSFSRTLEQVEEQQVEQEMCETVVAFVHAEQADEADRPRVFRHMLKHLKWLANKRQLRRVVLHSFTHLGGATAEAGFARQLLDDLRQRLEETGYEVAITPFGYFCEWELKVYGESLAKVWKSI
jgi:hypothetical protein